MIKQNIGTNREFTVDITYMKKILCPEFRKKNDDASRASLRNTLKKYDIILRSKLQDDGNMKMTMRQSL